MKKIITKPQYFFFFLALIMLISGFIFKENSIGLIFAGAIMDLNIWTLNLFSALFFMLIAVNYASLTITNKNAKTGLSVAHIIIQIIAIIPLFYIFLESGSKKTYSEISDMNIILMMAFGIFILATIIHLINFFVSLISKKD